MDRLLWIQRLLEPDAATTRPGGSAKNASLAALVPAVLNTSLKSSVVHSPQNLVGLFGRYGFVLGENAPHHLKSELTTDHDPHGWMRSLLEELNVEIFQMIFPCDPDYVHLEEIQTVEHTDELRALPVHDVKADIHEVEAWFSAGDWDPTECKQWVECLQKGGCLTLNDNDKTDFGKHIPRSGWLEKQIDAKGNVKNRYDLGR